MSDLRFARIGTSELAAGRYDACGQLSDHRWARATLYRMPGQLPRDPFTTADARAAGYSAGQIQKRLDAGDWVTLRRGVYCTATRHAYACTFPRLVHELDVLAAQLAVLRPTVASGWSAALLHGLPMPITWAGQPPPVVTLTLPNGHGKRLSGVRLRAGVVGDDQELVSSGIPVTSPARTAIDLARWADNLADAVAVADAVLRWGDATREQLAGLLTRFAACQGSVKARRVIELADPRAESPLESHSRVMFAEHGLPIPESQIKVHDTSGQLIGRVDFLWREMNTIGEADGQLKYTVGEVVYREKQREDRLRDLGFEVVRWDFADIRYSPRATADRIRSAFGRASRRRSR